MRGGALSEPTINKSIVHAVVGRPGLGGAHGLSTCMGALGNFGLALAAKGADDDFETDPWVLRTSR